MSSMQRLQAMYNSKQQEWEVAHERFTSLRQARLIETDASSQFKLDKQIKVAEHELTVIQQELDSLERQISQQDNSKRSASSQELNQPPRSKETQGKVPRQSEGSFEQPSSNLNKEYQPQISVGDSKILTRRNFVLLSVFSLGIWFSFWSLDNRNKASLYKKESALFEYLSVLAQTQRSFYVKHGRSAPNLELLGLDLPPETKDYRYSIEINGDKTVVRAEALNDQVRSSTGATVTATLFNELRTFYGACKADAPGSSSPSAPVLIGDSFQCLPGSSVGVTGFVWQ